ncbi:alpha/beta fold hydrolase [Arthrobacter sp. AOP36-A1-22]|uniref:alpha/beta fold hydrolase n=1 Tax=Arthrobacter sp. AOP36-A1-22 TaxID=3457684 RepID=UPI004033B74F
MAPVENTGADRPATAHHEAEHRVEGTENSLAVRIFSAGDDSASRPVLLIHGFASSTELNWVATGWITALNDAGRKVIAVDLPGHGLSPAPDDLDAYTPSRIRAELLQILQDQHVRPLADGDPDSGVDVLGYSLGSRLAWEFAGTQDQLVRRVVLGGPASNDPLATFDLDAAREHLAGGSEIGDPTTAELVRMAQLVPTNNMFSMLSLIEAIKSEPFDPAEAVPSMPVLLVAGERDELAATLPTLVQLAQEHQGPGAEVQELILPVRTHANAVTSRAYKQAAVEFING